MLSQSGVTQTEILDLDFNWLTPLAQAGCSSGSNVTNVPTEMFWSSTSRP